MDHLKPKKELPPIDFNGDLSSLSRFDSFDTKGPGPRCVLMSGAIIQKLGYLETDGDREKEIIYDVDPKKANPGPDPRYEFLIKYAKHFRECADKAYSSKDIKQLPPFVSSRDAKEFVDNTDNQTGFEKLSAKYFTAIIRNKKILGPYNSATASEIKSEDEIHRKSYGYPLKSHIYKDEESLRLSLDYLMKSFDLTINNLEKSIKSGEGINNLEYIDDIGAYKGQRGAVCRHYAGAMAVMLNTADIPCHAFSCKAFATDMYSGDGHESVISDKTGNIIEATSANLDNTYRVCIASTGRHKTNIPPLEALKSGGQIITRTPNNDVLMYSTRPIGNDENIAATKYMLKTIEEALKNKNLDSAHKINKLVAQVNRDIADGKPLSDKQVFEFAKEEVRRITDKDSWEKLCDLIKQVNPIHLSKPPINDKPEFPQH